MNKKASERIPTLTNLVKRGNSSMENHFDGHFLDEQQQGDEPAATAPVQFDQQTINDLVNEVIHTSMPIIERQLRNQLSGILKKYQSKKQS